MSLLARDLAVEEAIEMGVMYLGAPASVTDPLANLGSFPGLAAGTLAPGASLVPEDLVQGSPAISLDGVSGYLDTHFLTRRNLYPYDWSTGPALQSSGGGSYGYEEDLVPQTGHTKALKVICAAGVSGVLRNTGSGNIQVTAKTAYVLVVPVKAPAGQKFRFRFQQLKPGAEGGLENVSFGTSADMIGTGEWTLYSQLIVATTEATTALRVWFFNGSDEAAGSYLVGPPHVEARATIPTEAELFKKAQFTEGVAGYSGIAHESASDVGPWAAGTSRTYMAVVRYPTGSTTQGGIFGTLGTAQHSGIYLTGEGKVAFRHANGEANSTVECPITLDGKVHVVAFAYDNATKKVSFYQDGVLLKTSTALTVEPADAPLSLVLGRRYNQPTFYPEPVSFPMVFPSALSGEQVARLSAVLRRVYGGNVASADLFTAEARMHRRRHDSSSVEAPSGVACSARRRRRAAASAIGHSFASAAEIRRRWSRSRSVATSSTAAALHRYYPHAAKGSIGDEPIGSLEIGP